MARIVPLNLLAIQCFQSKKKQGIHQAKPDYAPQSACVREIPSLKIREKSGRKKQGPTKPQHIEQRKKEDDCATSYKYNNNNNNDNKEEATNRKGEKRNTVLPEGDDAG
ncbi:uncharacterized protein PGTG_18030 [Puccinia graminis f. sp. tritici CRL 75-36-700-3]|uniref:Uncharacterized protein n=1 Tax=Puccinia graminis f. sp. tritici (strain CRL 75-36-700-3 / race SCCL) TaxID=418459 RepID=E3L5L1_PUCGT|nr:uncharacterized protein PGTG_18030 [Puccinia graminis f. sp. tritici CRL 75-36-700-3]EFP91836.1 hypothetical protein PGTG_18030 [Puccinia graminis f. sp. tritici CRL 75-36-700-3]